MAINREMTTAEKEIKEYTQSQMEQTEHDESIVFTDEQKKILLEYGTMSGDLYNIRKKLRNLAKAIHTEDDQMMEDVLWECRREIEDFPDTSVGMSELKGYGYIADDMFPVRKEKALELHRLGEKIYCLQTDGSRGEYASRDMILDHEGLYGIEKEAWQHMNEQEEEYELEYLGEVSHGQG